MRNHFLPPRFIWLAFILLGHVASFSQAGVTSTTGYTVTVTLTPISILPSTTSCTWGYNYNVKVKYVVSFSGTNIPSSLYTLQGTVGCGADANFFSLPLSGGSGTLTTTSNPWRGVSDCNTASVVSLACTTAKLTINGPGITSRIVPLSIVPQPLPIKLVDFNAVLETNEVKLSWTTADEINNQFFAIERSADGDHWQEIGRVNGAGNSTILLNYEYMDLHPLVGDSYYRLRQIDIDGHSEISMVRTVKYLQTSKGITIYPVPNSGNTIFINGITGSKNYKLSVSTQNGDIIFSSVINSSSLTLPEMADGFYIISLRDLQTGQTENLRYIQLKH